MSTPGYGSKIASTFGISLATIATYLASHSYFHRAPVPAPGTPTVHTSSPRGKSQGASKQTAAQPTSQVSIPGQQQQPTAPTEDPNSPIMNGVDLSPAVDFISQYVDTLDHPVYLYHWFSIPGVSTTSGIESTAAPGLKKVMGGANDYWKYWNQTDPNGNRLGDGYYAMTDPTLTRSYGGKNWFLFQTQIPAGFRYIHLVNHRYVKVPSDVQAIFTQLGCTLNLKTMYGFFDPTWPSKQPESCRAAMERVFNNLVQLDGVFYHYQDVPFAPCAAPKSEGPAYAGAFLISNGSRWADSTNVRVFNAGTTDDPEDRARIESIFYLKTQRSTFVASGKGRPEMLWPDLVGQPTLPDTRDWIQENFFRCVDYGQAK